MPEAESVMDLGVLDMVVVFSFLILPVVVFVQMKIAVMREMFSAVARMSIQLFLVGLYLRFLFRINSVWLNMLWIGVMITCANASTLSKSGLSWRRYFGALSIGTACSALLMTGLFVFAVIRPTPLYDARYMIPLAGMILGNCLRGNVVALERFFSSLTNGRKEHLTRLFLGAGRLEAVMPYIRSSLRAAVMPSLSTMATMGVVSLPGMMTGQILGGSVPMVAIKYQIAIMICIFCGITLACASNLYFAAMIALDDYGMLRDN